MSREARMIDLSHWRPGFVRAFIQAMRDEGLVVEDRDDRIQMRQWTEEQEARIAQRMRELEADE
jgi:hypothetical protein